MKQLLARLLLAAVVLAGCGPATQPQVQQPEKFGLIYPAPGGGGRQVLTSTPTTLALWGDSNGVGPTFSSAQSAWRGPLMLVRPDIYLPVGSLSTSPPPLPVPQHLNKHECHVGFTSADFVTNMVAYWAANPASIVLFNIGTNDAIAARTAAAVAADVVTVVDYIHAQSPNTVIHFATAINMRSDQTAGNANLDLQRPAVLAALAGKSWVRAKEMPKTIPDSEFDDPYHLLGPGYQRMRDVWASGL